MPLSKYNKQFGGKPGSAEEAHSAMIAEYGAKKGEQVFYATKNKRKSQDPKHAASFPNTRKQSKYNGHLELKAETKRK